MKSVICIAVLAMAICAQTAQAFEPDRISVLLGSEHNGAERNFQETNPGVFLTWERNLSYSFGVYYNSYKEVSPLVSVGYNYEIAPAFDVGAFFAVAVYPGDGDEFDHSVGDVVPFVGVQARWKYFFVQFVPADGDALDSLFTFGLTFELD